MPDATHKTKTYRVKVKKAETHHLVLVFTEKHIYELRIHECMIVTEITLALVIWVALNQEYFCSQNRPL